MKAAIERVSSRLPSGLNFVDVFGELEFILHPEGNYSAFTDIEQVYWYADEMALEIELNLDLEATVVHEFGHVLANRLGRDASDTFLSTALIGGNNLIPFLQEGIDVNMPIEGRAGGSFERPADYFMFWVYDAIIGDSIEAEVARAFLSGDKVIIWRRSGQPAGEYRLVENNQVAITSAILELTGLESDEDLVNCGISVPSSLSVGFPILSALGTNNECEIVAILSPGMDYWLRLALGPIVKGG